MEKTHACRAGIVMVAVLALSLVCLPAYAAPIKKAGEDNALLSQPQKDYKAAVEKNCFFVSFKNNRVSLVEENSYRKLSYLVADNVRIIAKGELVEWSNLVIHSLCHVVIVDGIVVEITVLEVPS